MSNDYLDYIIEAWDNLTWIQKQRIVWLHWRSKMGIGNREITSTLAIVALFFLVGIETHLAHKFVMASAIILMHFYILLFRKLLPHN